jgi:hypothetical protein
MHSIDSIGDERLLVSHHGHDALAISVTDPRFGGLATVRLSRDQAVELASALTGMLLDLGHRPAPEPR